MSRDEANKACDNNKMVACAPDESVCVAGEKQVSRSLFLVQRFCSSRKMLDEMKKQCEDKKKSADSLCKVAICEIAGCTQAFVTWCVSQLTVFLRYHETS